MMLVGVLCWGMLKIQREMPRDRGIDILVRILEIAMDKTKAAG
jgi:hypothetical protein